MTADEIVEAASHLPREQMAELLDRLSLVLHAGIDPDTEAAWKQETRRRLAELESGKTDGIAGDAVSARVRKIVGR